MVLTMAAVAGHKQIPINRLEAIVESRAEFSGGQTATHFVTHLDLGEGLTARERRILYNSARHCEVHKMLQGQVTFEEHLTDLDP